MGLGANETYHLLASSTILPESANNFISAVGTFVNGLVGLCILTLALAFAVFLILWVFASDGSDAQKIGVRGSYRAVLALFMLFNMWAFLRLLDAIASLSPIATFLVFLGSFILLTSWSLFSVGDGLTYLISLGVNASITCVDILLCKLFPSLADQSRSISRFLALGVLIALATICLAWITVPSARKVSVVSMTARLDAEFQRAILTK